MNTYHYVTYGGTIECSCGRTFFAKAQLGMRSTDQNLARANAARHAKAANAKATK